LGRTFVSDRLSCVRPGRFVPWNCHWYVSGALPAAVTPKLAVLKMWFVAACGGTTMAGGVESTVTTPLLVASGRDAPHTSASSSAMGWFVKLSAVPPGVSSARNRTVTTVPVPAA
jgi:hypothetical protein